MSTKYNNIRFYVKHKLLIVLITKKKVRDNLLKFAGTSLGIDVGKGLFKFKVLIIKYCTGEHDFTR